MEDVVAAMTGALTFHEEEEDAMTTHDDADPRRARGLEAPPSARAWWKRLIAGRARRSG